ncbi:MAG: molybdenum cofactor guanylyltransferase [Proteobacteria bacterium]|nr:molybdenum cofactor guanylyltransferase [Pseudomonadota bacterium]
MCHPDVTGVILAGGLGRRMGGVDKGLQLLNGKALVRHVAERLAPQVGALMINANRSQAEYVALGYPVLADAIPDFAGPLAGLHAALVASATPLVLTVPCDSPYLPLDLVARLYAGMREKGADLAIARADGRVHPVFCLCRTSLAPQLAAFLNEGGRRVMEWCQRAGCVEVDFDDQPAAFGNFNTLDDLAGAG